MLARFYGFESRPLATNFAPEKQSRLTSDPTAQGKQCRQKNRVVPLAMMRELTVGDWPLKIGRGGANPYTCW